MDKATADHNAQAEGEYVPAVGINYDYLCFSADQLPLMKLVPDETWAIPECSGRTIQLKDHSWTPDEFDYRKYHTKATLTLAVDVLWKRDLMTNLANGLSAAVYTEVSDVEDETNGLLTYDREILKVDPEVISRINRELLEEFDRVTG